MFVFTAPSKKCSPQEVAVPLRIRKRYNIDVGDILVFNTSKGPVPLMVCKAYKNDVASQGDGVVFVNEEVLRDKEGQIFVIRHKLTLGGDPELFLIHKKTKDIVEAYRYLAFNAPIGSDGALAELRPRYGYSPEELVSHIKDMIIRLRSLLPKHLDLHASSWYRGMSCGFHVHFGLPEEILLLPTEQSQAVMENIVSALDYFVAIVGAILEDSDRRRLYAVQYGNPGDFRVNVRTLEYRTLGGYFLSSPALAHLMYSASFSLVRKLLQEMQDDSDNWLYMDNVAPYAYMRDKFGLPSRRRIKNLFRSPRPTLIKELPRIVAASVVDMEELLNLTETDLTFRRWYEESEATIRRLGDGPAEADTSGSKMVAGVL